MACAAYVRVVAVVPSLVREAVHFAHVVASVQGATVVRDAIQLVGGGLLLARVAYKNGKKPASRFTFQI